MKNIRQIGVCFLVDKENERAWALAHALSF